MKRMWSLKQIKEFIKGTTKDISTLVDADGHERFIEGDIELVDGAIPTKVYGKWALSGSHLLMVLVVNAKDEDVIPNGFLTKDINLPSWVREKIVTTFGNNVIRGNALFFDDNAGLQSTYVYLQKSAGGAIQFYLSSVTLTADRQARIVFDLLIDNE